MNKKTCNKKAVQKDWIERLVVMNMQNFVLQDDVIDAPANSILELYN